MDPKNDAEQKDFDENSNKLISECGIPIFIQYASNLIAHLLATSLEPATLAAESPWRTSPLRSPTRSTTQRHLGFSTFHFLEVWSRYYSNLQPKGNGPDLCFWQGMWHTENWSSRSFAQAQKQLLIVVLLWASSRGSFAYVDTNGSDRIEMLPGRQGKWQFQAWNAQHGRRGWYKDAHQVGGLFPPEPGGLHCIPRCSELYFLVWTRIVQWISVSHVWTQSRHSHFCVWQHRHHWRKGIARPSFSTL